MVDDRADPLKCFGDLEKVFPRGEDGFRTSPPECMKCSLVKPCIQAAMRGVEGLKEEEKRVDRAYSCGLIGRRKIEEQDRHEKNRRKKTT
jgi:hypothetical protein